MSSPPRGYERTTPAAPWASSRCTPAAPVASTSTVALARTPPSSSSPPAPPSRHRAPLTLGVLEHRCTSSRPSGSLASSRASQRMARRSARRPSGWRCAARCGTTLCHALGHALSGLCPPRRRGHRTCAAVRVADGARVLRAQLVHIAREIVKDGSQRELLLGRVAPARSPSMVMKKRSSITAAKEMAEGSLPPVGMLLESSTHTPIGRRRRPSPSRARPSKAPRSTHAGATNPPSPLPPSGTTSSRRSCTSRTSCATSWLNRIRCRSSWSPMSPRSRRTRAIAAMARCSRRPLAQPRVKWRICRPPSTRNCRTGNSHPWRTRELSISEAPASCRPLCSGSCQFLDPVVRWSLSVCCVCSRGERSSVPRTRLPYGTVSGTRPPRAAV